MSRELAVKDIKILNLEILHMVPEFVPNMKSELEKLYTLLDFQQN